MKPHFLSGSINAVIISDGFGILNSVACELC